MSRGATSRLGGLLACVALCLASPASARAQTPAEAAKSSPQAIRLYRSAVNIQNSGHYEQAGDEWQELLEKFPNDPLAPKVEHYLGVCRLQTKQFDAAEKAFKHVVSAYPTFELLETTYLDLGIAQYGRAVAAKAAPSDAIETLTATVRKFPSGKHIAAAYYYLGESLYAAGRKAEAVDAYGKSIANDTEKAFKAEALNAQGATLQELNKPAEAGAAFDAFLKEFPSHPLNADATLHRAETLLARGAFADAQKGFAAARAMPEAPWADFALLREAECLAQQKRYVEAAALNASLIDKYPQSTYRSAAELAAGNCYYLADKLPEAERWLGKVATAGGENAAEAAHWLARAYLKQKRPGDAKRVAEQALPTAGKGPMAAELALDQADAVYELEPPGAAVPLYAATAKNYPDQPAARTALYMAGFAALSAGDFGAAGAYSDAFLKRYPDAALADEVRYVGAEAKLLSGDFATAVKLYDALINAAPQRAEAPAWKLRRATALLLEKKYPEVVAALSSGFEAFPTPEQKAEAHYLLGSARLELREIEPASKEFAASLAAAPKWRQADETLLQLAAAQRRSNKLSEAIATARRVGVEFPQSRVLDQALCRVGEYCSAAGDYRGSIDAYQQLVARWPDSPFAPYAWNGLGWDELDLNEPAPAVEAFTKVIELEAKRPASVKSALAPLAYSGRARARQALKKPLEAIADIQVFLKSEPKGVERSDALFVEAMCNSALGNNAAAMTAFESILKDDPAYNSADRVLYELAWVQMAEKKDDAAAATFVRLAKEHPLSPLAAESLYRVGEQQYQLKDYAGAAASYSSVIGKAGKSDLGERAAYKLAWAEYQQGQFERAEQAFASLLTAFPRNPRHDDIEFMAAECLFRQNKFEPALAAYQRALAQPTDNKNTQFLILLHAGQSATQLRKWQDGVGVLERALKEFPDSSNAPEAAFELAACKQNLGDEAGAYKLYEQAADADREVGARARFMMGESLFAKKSFPDAIRQFMKVAYGYGYPSASDNVKKWQADAVFEAGRCFENLRKLDDAKKSYTEVVEKYPRSPRASAAKARLQELGS